MYKLAEKIRTVLLIPSLAQWAKWSLPSKLSAVGTALGLVGVALAIYALPPNMSQEPPKRAYDLSQPRRKEFLELLKTTQTEERDTLRIGCVAWSEASCLAAGKFLTLFSEAGWKIDSDRVFRMEPNIPVDGMTIAARSDDIANFEKLPPHLGRWASMDQSQTIILMAFKYMDNPVKFSRDPSLPPRTLGIYFGPEPSLTQAITPDQKIVRKPLVTFLSAATAVEHACSLGQNQQCKNMLTPWESEVSMHLGNRGFDSAAIGKWKNLSKSAERFSMGNIEKQKNLLITLFLGLE